jgi:hypothetical protein
MTLEVSQHTPPHKRNIDLRFEKGEMFLIEIANNHTFPLYGNSNYEWREWRKASLSYVASSQWLLLCTLKNLIVLRLVTRSF